MSETEIVARLVALETKFNVLIGAIVLLAVPVYGQLIALFIQTKIKGDSIMRKLSLFFILLSLCSMAYAAAPLDIQLDPATHGVVLTGVCLGLSEAWKRIFPKVSKKWVPWVSLGLGVAGATVTGFDAGNNIGQVLSGIACGGAAMVSYDLGATVNAALRLLGVRKR
ncbi:MAG: hypothetical protein WC683_17405 [bacterium]